MDTLKGKLTGETPKAELGQTERVSRLAQAKTGREAGPSEGPRRSSIQEKSAAQTTQTGMDQQSLANRLQSQEISQKETAQDIQAEETRLNLANRLESYQTAFERQSEDVLREFERDTRSLEDSKDAAKTEQLGFLLRLQNQQYITQLQSEGQMDRFNSSIAFKEAATRSALDDMKEILDNELAHDLFMGASNREFKEQVSQMDISFAQNLADSQLKAEKQRAIFSGIGNVAAGAAQYYADNPSKSGDK